jgi:hypothetical protein
MSTGNQNLKKIKLIKGKKKKNQTRGGGK